MKTEPGTEISGFKAVSVDSLDEYKSRGVRYTHTGTGMDVYHVENDDTENVFAYVFTTPPSDDTGVAHITEHAVLAGSKQFPVKDPFLALMKGSVNTFLNAMTFPDKTVYPAASPVHEDFFNLLSVYSDAVFNPLLRKEIFHQEGKRDLIDTEGVLDVTGIVYNEMKGAFSSFDTVVADSSFRLLFPDTPYFFESGGIPEAIRELDYSDFLSFYKTYYHPSNCKLYLYGDIPASEILPVVETYISRFSRRDETVVIPRQKNWDAPRYFSVAGPSGRDASEKTTFTINWRLAPLSNSREVLSFELLSEILLGNHGAPMYKALFECPYGEDLSPACGIETDLQDLVFTLGIRGAETDQRDAFTAFVFDQLKDLSEKGIPKDIIEGAFTRVEFRNREIKGGFPFGLRLMSRSLRGWLHGLAPKETMGFEDDFQAIKQAYSKNSGLFEDLIQKYMLRNTHYSVLTVESSPEYMAEKDAGHLEWRQKKTSALTQDMKRSIEDDLEKFGLFQSTVDSPEDMNKIPSLSLSDIPETIRTISSRKSSVHDRLLYEHQEFTNGIIYSDFAFPIGVLPREEELLLPFFGKVLTSVGVGELSYDEAASKLSLISGGVFSFLEVSSNALSGESLAYLFFRIKAVYEHNSEALDFLGRIFSEAHMDDRKRIKSLLIEYRNELRSSIISSGHSFAMLRAGSRISPSLMREEHWRGVEQFLFIQELAEQVDSRMDEIIAVFLSLKNKILVSSRAVCNITCEKDHIDAAREGVAEVLRHLPQGSLKKAPPVTAAGLPSERGDEAFIVPSTVNYVAAAMPGSFLDSEEYACDALIAHILKTEQLWEKIRMQGGAYGAFSSVNGTEGLFYFGSYRDPHVADTYRSYLESLKELEHTLNETVIEKAKIALLGREFKPQAPGEMSMIGFRRELYGIPDEMRQRKHMRIYNVTLEALKSRVTDLTELYTSRKAAVVVGEEKRIKEAVGDGSFNGSVIELM